MRNCPAASKLALSRISRLRFRYITTASVGIERDWPDENGGIATWEVLRRGELSGDNRGAALGRIRDFLTGCECPERARGAWKYLEAF